MQKFVLSYPASSHCVSDFLHFQSGCRDSPKSDYMCRWDGDRSKDKNGEAEFQAMKQWVTCTQNTSCGSCTAVWSTEVTISEGTGISLLNGFLPLWLFNIAAKCYSVPQRVRGKYAVELECTQERQEGEFGVTFYSKIKWNSFNCVWSTHCTFLMTGWLDHVRPNLEKMCPFFISFSLVFSFSRWKHTRECSTFCSFSAIWQEWERNHTHWRK